MVNGTRKEGTRRKSCEILTMDAPAYSPTPMGSTLRQRRPTSAQKDRQQLELQISSAALSAVPTAVQYVQQFAPLLVHAAELIAHVGPVYFRAAAFAASVYQTLPLDVLQALLGLGLCFFGGSYYASIAAVEAFMMVGGSTTRAALEDIYEDVLLIQEAHERDEQQQAAARERRASGLKPAELVQRKMRVAVLAVRDPEKLSQAIGGLYAGWIAVQGTLRLEFAKTITLGVSIAAMLDRPALRYGLPVLAHAVPKEFHRWLPTVIRTVCKLAAVTVAWWLAVAIAAFQSALRGGLLCSRALLRWANAKGFVALTPEDSTLDEGLGYALCALGFYTQWVWGFSMPFPFNIVLMPFTLVEWYLRWSITSSP